MPSMKNLVKKDEPLAIVPSLNEKTESATKHLKMQGRIGQGENGSAIKIQVRCAPRNKPFGITFGMVLPAEVGERLGSIPCLLPSLHEVATGEESAKYFGLQARLEEKEGMLHLQIPASEHPNKNRPYGFGLKVKVEGSPDLEETEILALLKSVNAGATKEKMAVLPLKMIPPAGVEMDVS